MNIMNPFVKISISSLAVASLLFAVGCGGESNTSDDKTVTKIEQSEGSLWLKTAPEGAIAVSEARSLTPGAVVAVEGVIGGVVHPFTEGFAVFVLGDDALVYCNEMEDDHCATPWDACCEDTDLRKRSIASIEIVGLDGLPIEESAQSMLGLKELDKIVVAGTVAENSTPENLIIVASGIYKQS